MIKGRGGALLREKVLAAAARRLVIMIDPRKEVATLGAGTRPFQSEVTPFAVPVVARTLAAWGARVAARATVGETPYVTDGGNHILDCHFGPLADPDGLAARLDRVVGVVEHGLFLDFSPTIIVGGRA